MSQENFVDFHVQPRPGCAETCHFSVIGAGYGACGAGRFGLQCSATGGLQPRGPMGTRDGYGRPQSHLHSLSSVWPGGAMFNVQAPTMVLLVSNDNGISWEAPRSLLASSSDNSMRRLGRPQRRANALCIVDARQTRYYRGAVAGLWPLLVVCCRRTISGNQIDKPVLAVRGPNVYVSFNHDQTLAVAASHDYAQTFSATVLNPGAETGWSLAASAVVDPRQCLFFLDGLPANRSSHASGGSIYSRSGDGGGTWSTALMDVPARHRIARPGSVRAAFWLRRWLWLPMTPGSSMLCGTRARPLGDRSTFTSPLPQTRGKLVRKG